MKKYFDQPLIPLRENIYLCLLTFLAPLLNFLPGINIDMYAPSMPAIANYYVVSALVVKNTIAVSILGLAIGCLLFGVLMDRIGRKRSLVIGLFLYMVVSFFAAWSSTIVILMMLRFIQGVSIAAVVVGCRTIIVDNMTDKRYAITFLYASIAYGLGPIVGPFIGGVLQYHYGWQANFIAFGIVSLVLLLLLIFFLKESLPPEKPPLRLKNISSQYLRILQHTSFMVGVFIIAITQIELMIYPTLGPFIVENILHRNALTYGNSALAVGGSYLVGAMINRGLIKYIRPRSICNLGLSIMVLAVIVAYLFSWLSPLALITVVVPLILIGLGNGLFSSHVMGTNLLFFAQNAGMAMAIQASLLILLTAVGIFGLSHLDITHLLALSYLYTVLVVSQVFVFYKWFCGHLS